MTLKRKYNFRFTLIAFIATVALVLPSNYVHELGHGAICNWKGYDFTFAVGFEGGRLDCEGIPEPDYLFYFMGGGTAALVFFGAGVLAGFRLKAVEVACLTVAASNLMVAFLETFAHDFYMSANSFVVLGINSVAFAIWFGFVIYFHPKKDVSPNSAGVQTA